MSCFELCYLNKDSILVVITSIDNKKEIVVNSEKESSNAFLVGIYTAPLSLCHEGRKMEGLHSMRRRKIESVIPGLHGNSAPFGSHMDTHGSRSFSHDQEGMGRNMESNDVSGSSIFLLAE